MRGCQLSSSLEGSCAPFDCQTERKLPKVLMGLRASSERLSSVKFNGGRVDTLKAAATIELIRHLPCKWPAR